MRNIILAAAAILTLSSAAAFAESPNTTNQSLGQQSGIEASQAVGSFGLSSAATDAEPIGSGRAATELRSMTYGD